MSATPSAVAAIATKDEKLKEYFNQVSSIILSKQNAATGLIPASVAITTHGDYTDAWVRDNVYSIMAVWGLSLAYKKLDRKDPKAFELQSATIKCMRGLLSSMIRQSEKVELFKINQTTSNCLHAKYNTQTGATVVGDDEWGHLQIDATSIFLLNLAQMTASGLTIIYTMDEVNFVQNLVYYIERAYRTPDYGIWERGNKTNHGLPELNSSSIGMAVAALQAINGINLFGASGGPASVIHVLPDELTRNYATLKSALPRESYSKEIDASLLSVISFPGFAVHDNKLVDRTRAQIIKKLGGEYGCKRFLRDGHQTVVEDHNRPSYEPHDLKVFEGIECEWPLFFTYLILDGQFSGNQEQTDFYRAKLAPLLVDSTTIPMFNRDAQNSDSFTKKNLPPAHMKLCPGLVTNCANTRLELYIVPEDLIEAEKANPNSQKRVANENVPLVWAQSLLILGNLIHDALITTSDLDPLGKRLHPYRSTDKEKAETVVQVVILAENTDLQARMAKYGLVTQTVEECDQVIVSTDSALRNAFTSLGENAKLKLTGRPRRPVGTLSTCKLYRCQDRLYTFLPHFMDREEYYLVSDNNYFISVFEQELSFVRNNWIGCERPTMVILLTEEVLGVGWEQKEESKKKNLLDFMISLKHGVCGGVKIKVGKMSDMVATSNIQSLDFLVSAVNSDAEDWVRILKRQDNVRGTGKNLKQSQKESRSRIKYKRDRSLTSGSVDQDDLATNPLFEQRVDTGVKTAALPTTGASDDNEAVIISSANALAEHLDEHPGAAKPEIESDPDVLTLTLNDTGNLDRAIELLKESRNLYDQIDILHYINSVKGLDYTIDNLGTVRELIEEVYLKSTQLKRWSIVRQAAGLLQKLVNKLPLTVTELLIRGKPVTIGYGKKEVFVNSPMTPGQLVEILFQCSSDIREAPLVQEILIYLAAFVRSSGSMLDGVMRIRTHYFIIALREEIMRMRECDEEAAIEYLMELSPSEMKSLLGQVLTAATQLKHKVDPSAIAYSTADRWRKIYDQCHQKSHEPHPSGIAHMLKITAQSGGLKDGDFARIEVERDGNRLQIPLNFARGLNVVVLDPLDGIVVETATFDSCMSCDESDEFARMIEWLDDGIIVVLICKDDCTENMTEAAKSACEDIGSRKVRDVNYRDSWCLIGQKNGLDAVESLISSTQGSSDPIVATFDLTARRHRVFSCLPKDCELNGKDFFSHGPNMNLFLPSHGRWIRRRKNDGALNRAPPLFYPKVWTVLSQCKGISIHTKFLPRDPTISEKTPEELSFGLEFESLLDTIRDPAERQMAVDCLVVIYWLTINNPNEKMSDRALNLLDILRDAMETHWKHWIKEGESVKSTLEKRDDPSGSSSATMLANALQAIGTSFEKNEQFARRLFFDLPSIGEEGSDSYLTASAVKIVWDGRISGTSFVDEDCPVFKEEKEG